MFFTKHCCHVCSLLRKPVYCLSNELFLESTDYCCVDNNIEYSVWLIKVINVKRFISIYWINCWMNCLGLCFVNHSVQAVKSSGKDDKNGCFFSVSFTLRSELSLSFCLLFSKKKITIFTDATYHIKSVLWIEIITRFLFGLFLFFSSVKQQN